MSRIGEALLTAALKQKEEGVKKSHISLGPKSVSPKKMVLESLRMPKRKGKRNVATDEENIMNIQKHQGKGKFCFVRICFDSNKIESCLVRQLRQLVRQLRQNFMATIIN